MANLTLDDWKELFKRRQLPTNEDVQALRNPEKPKEELPKPYGPGEVDPNLADWEAHRKTLQPAAMPQEVAKPATAAAPTPAVMPYDVSKLTPFSGPAPANIDPSQPANPPGEFKNQPLGAGASSASAAPVAAEMTAGEKLAQELEYAAAQLPTDEPEAVDNAQEEASEPSDPTAYQPSAQDSAPAPQYRDLTKDDITKALGKKPGRLSNAAFMLTGGLLGENRLAYNKDERDLRKARIASEENRYTYDPRLTARLEQAKIGADTRKVTTGMRTGSQERIAAGRNAVASKGYDVKKSIADANNVTAQKRADSYAATQKAYADLGEKRLTAQQQMAADKLKASSENNARDNTTRIEVQRMVNEGKQLVSAVDNRQLSEQQFQQFSGGVPSNVYKQLVASAATFDPTARANLARINAVIAGNIAKQQSGEGTTPANDPRARFQNFQ